MKKNNKTQHFYFVYVEQHTISLKIFLFCFVLFKGGTDRKGKERIGSWSIAETSGYTPLSSVPWYQCGHIATQLMTLSFTVARWGQEARSAYGDVSGNDGCHSCVIPLKGKHIPPLPKLILLPTDCQVHVQVGSPVDIYTRVGSRVLKMVEQQDERRLDPWHFQVDRELWTAHIGNAVWWRDGILSLLFKSLSLPESESKTFQVHV